MKPSNILYCLLAVSLLLGLPAWGQTPPMEYEYEFGITQLSPHYVTDSTTMEEFVYYTCADLDLTSQVGAPTLPVKYVRFSVPYNADNISLSVDASYSDLSTYGKRIYPVQEPIPTGERSGNQSFALDSAIYYGNAYWPSSVAEIVSDGFYLGDNRVITVAIYPLQYKAKNGNLRLYSYIDLGINYTIGATPGNILVRQDATLRQQEMNQVKTLVENPENVESFSTEANITQLAPVQGDPQPQAQYLIIAPDSLASSFKRLAAFKRQKGYTVDVVTVEQIVNDPMYANGDVSIKANQDTISAINDPAGKIRQYLKDAHNNRGTQFVLLGGKNVPFRYAYQKSTQVPTDLYYSSLSSVWELNHNGLYGDPTDLKNDPLSASVYVGRLLCSTPEQMDNYTDKLFRYCLNPGNGDMSFLTRSYFYEGYDLRGETEDIRSQLNNIGFSDTLVFEHEYQRTPFAQDIMQEWNSTKYGFLGLFNHADHKQLTVYGYSHRLGKKNNYYIYDPPISCLWALDSQIPQGRDSMDTSLEHMSCKNHPSIAYSIACHHMPYDEDWTFGTSFTLLKNIGGPAFLGNTRDGYHGKNMVSDLLCKLFVQALANGVTRIGEAEALSKENYQIQSDKAYFASVHNLLGDPEFEVWTDVPSIFTLPTISRTDNSLTVSGFESDTTTIIAISNGLTQKSQTPSNGSAVFQNVNPNSTIMLYRHNYLPWIAPLVLQNERVTDDRYIIASDVTAGRSVDANRTAGDFVIATGTTYEIEHKGTVSLQPGFKVEKGASFSVKPSDY